MELKEQAVNQEKCDSGGLDQKRLGLSFDPVKKLDRRCMRVWGVRSGYVNPSIWEPWIQFEAELLRSSEQDSEKMFPAKRNKR